MLTLILSLLGLGGGLGALAYFLGPAAMLGFGRSALAFLRSIPWQAYAIAALVGLIAFLMISRSHLQAQVKADAAREAIVCQAVRDVAGRPKQDCRLAAQQIRAFGGSITTLEQALADQNRHIRALGEKSAQQQAASAEASRIAQERARDAEGVVGRLEASSRSSMPQNGACAPSKTLQEQWQ